MGIVEYIHILSKSDTYSVMCAPNLGMKICDASFWYVLPLDPCHFSPITVHYLTLCKLQVFRNTGVDTGIEICVFCGREFKSADLMQKEMDKNSAEAPIEMKPSIIEFVDNCGYTRRMVVRGGSSCLPHLSFQDFTLEVKKIFGLPSGMRIRMVYKREGGCIVAVETEAEFEAACLDINSTQSLGPVVFERNTYSVFWEKVSEGQPAVAATATNSKYPELSQDHCHPANATLF